MRFAAWQTAFELFLKTCNVRFLEQIGKVRVWRETKRRQDWSTSKVELITGDSTVGGTNFFLRLIHSFSPLFSVVVILPSPNTCPLLPCTDMQIVYHLARVAKQDHNQPASPSQNSLLVPNKITRLSPKIMPERMFSVTEVPSTFIIYIKQKDRKIKWDYCLARDQT